MHTTYGADKNGLICGYLFTAGVLVNLLEATAWLHNGTPKASR